MNYFQSAAVISIVQIFCNVRVAKVILIAGILACSQHVMSQSPIQWAKYGKLALEDGDLYAAIDYYSKAYRADTTKLNNLMQLANAYRMNNNYQMAEKWYQEVYSRPERTLFGMSAYWLARMQQSQGKYDIAEDNFERFANYEAEPGSYFWKDAKQQVKGCAWAEKAKKDSMNIEFQSMQFASNYADFGGTLINDSTLLYSSLQFAKKDSTLKLAKTERNKKVTILAAAPHDSNWIRNSNWDTVFSITNKHIGNASYFADSNWLLYSECPDYSSCKIKYRKWNGSSWEQPIELPPTVNLEGFSSTQPHMAIIKGKPTLFFVSNRPQGRGNLDIWYSTYEKRLKGFKYPRNMGRKVNTAGNEITPFYHPDSNRIYFSSDWWEGFGGYDVFEVNVSSLRSTSKAKNTGQPINTPTNDLYYWASTTNQIFVSSNRPGGEKMEGQTCCNDIYFANIQPPPVYVPPPPPPKDTISDSLPLVVSIEELNDYLPVLYFENDQPNPGTYLTETESNYKDLLSHFVEQKKTYQHGYQKIGKHNEHDSLANIIDTLFDNNIKMGLFDLNRFLEVLLPELEAGNTIHVTIRGFASPLASAAYNHSLSKRRISSIVNYIKSYDEGSIAPYLMKESEQGRLLIEEAPFGESATSTVSDSRNNKALSVYSPAAIKERRIEVIKVTED